MGDENSAPDLVLAERRGPVAVLTFNRPERLNAWTDELEDRYFDLLSAAESDPDVRAIVVTGAGRGFCAGADMAQLQAAAAQHGDTAPAGSRRPRWFPITIRKPMIAAINGAAAGLGLVEALYCDVRFAAAGAKLTTSFARRGLVAEYGIAWLLPRLVGQGHALDLLLSGRVVLAEDARAIGLIDVVVEPAADTVELAVSYAADLAQWCSPTSMAVIKEQVRRALGTDFASAIAEADRRMAEAFAAPDVAEGVASYLEGRAPVFAPLPTAVVL